MGLYDIIKTVKPTNKILTDDMYLIEDLGFDSLSLITLISTLEETYNIEFEDDDILFENFNKIGSLRKIIERLTAYE